MWGELKRGQESVMRKTLNEFLTASFSMLLLLQTSSYFCKSVYFK